MGQQRLDLRIRIFGSYSVWLILQVVHCFSLFSVVGWRGGAVARDLLHGILVPPYPRTFVPPILLSSQSLKERNNLLPRLEGVAAEGDACSQEILRPVVRGVVNEVIAV